MPKMYGTLRDPLPALEKGFIYVCHGICFKSRIDLLILIGTVMTVQSYRDIYLLR